jgi:hypothetical protein
MNEIKTECLALAPHMSFKTLFKPMEIRAQKNYRQVKVTARAEIQQQAQRHLASPFRVVLEELNPHCYELFAMNGPSPSMTELLFDKAGLPDAIHLPSQEGNLRLFLKKGNRRSVDCFYALKIKGNLTHLDSKLTLKHLGFR